MTRSLGVANNPVITDEMIRVWRILCEITAAGDDKFWEFNGGRLAEYYDADTRTQ